MALDQTQDITKQVVEQLVSKISLDSTRFVQGFVDAFYDKIVTALTKKEESTVLVQQDQDKPEPPSPKQNLDAVALAIGTQTSLLERLVRSAETSKDSKGDQWNRDLIADDKVTFVHLDGITDRGIQRFKRVLPDLFKDLWQVPTKTKMSAGSGGGSFGLVGAGLSVLAGGLAALVAGLMNDGPFKGLMKMAGKAGISGAIKLLEVGVKNFFRSLNLVVDAPLNALRAVAAKVGGLFGGLEATKAVLTNIPKAKGLMGGVLKGLGTFMKGALKKLPIVGTLISFGYAYTRFKSGDTAGGVIDVLSGLASLINLVPGGMAIGLPLMIGLDALNAFLDYKAGGLPSAGGKTKGAIMWDWAKGAGEWIKEKLMKFSIVGSIIGAGKLFSEGKWIDGLMEFNSWIPGIDWVYGLAGGKETIKENVVRSGDYMSQLWNWVVQQIYQIPIVQSLANVSSYLSSGDWAGALSSLGTMVPNLSDVLELFSVGGVANAAARATNAAVPIQALHDYVSQQVMQIPLIKDLTEAIGTGDWDKVLDVLDWVPGVASIRSMWSTLKTPKIIVPDIHELETEGLTKAPKVDERQQAFANTEATTPKFEPVTNNIEETSADSDTSLSVIDIDNDSIRGIAANTKRTNEKIELLAVAIVRLAEATASMKPQPLSLTPPAPTTSSQMSNAGGAPGAAAQGSPQIRKFRESIRWGI